MLQGEYLFSISYSQSYFQFILRCSQYQKVADWLRKINWWLQLPCWMDHAFGITRSSTISYVIKAWFNKHRVPTVEGSYKQRNGN